MKDKNKILSNYKSRLEDGIKHVPDNTPNDNREAVLLGELQIAQLELEMQNDELSMAVSLLESQRAKFEGFFNLAPIGYFIIDNMGLVEEANQIASKLLLTDRSKLLGQRLQSFIAPEDYELFYRFLQHLEPGGEKNSAVIRFSNHLHQLIYTRVEGIALMNHFTTKLQFYVTVSDITESRLAELELKDTTQRLELTLKVSGIGTWNIDSVSNRLYLDKYSLSLLGIKPWEFDNSLRSFFNFVHQDDQPLIRKVLQSTIQETSEIELEVRISSKEGDVKSIMLKGMIVSMDGENSHMVGIMVDVTRERKIETAKRKLEAEKQRLVYETTFSAQEKERERISSALHDSVCQLLYGIRLNLHNLQLEEGVQANFKNSQQLIAQAIKEIRELSYELTPAILTDFGLVAAINEMVGRLQNKAFRITTKLKSDVDQLPLDLQLSLFRICQELLNNVIKHSQATMAQIVIGTEDGKICLSVIDNGQGFKSEEGNIKAGSGLRAIRNRVFLLNGTVEVESGVGGTTVRVTINNKA